MRRYFLIIVLLLGWALPAAAEVAKELPAAIAADKTLPAAGALPYGVIDRELLQTAYVDGEKMLYEVFWTGGVKIGELSLEIKRIKGMKTATHQVKTVITTENGAIHGIYPVRDVHVTTVVGRDRLPTRYEVKQKEGHNYEAYRLTRYNQQTGRIWYKKNDDPSTTYMVQAPIHNEFSAFLGSRVMPFAVGQAFLVPTFADKRRNEVQVKVLARETLEGTVLGTVETMRVTPILKFKGLYDKQGDTVIWYTNDQCRVPVRINSRLMIGSLTLDLVSYDNVRCPQYHGAVPVEGKKAGKPVAAADRKTGGTNEEHTN